MDRQLKNLTSKVEAITDAMEKTAVAQGKVDETQLINKLNVREETAHKRLEDKVDNVMKAIGSQQMDAAKIQHCHITVARFGSILYGLAACPNNNCLYTTDCNNDSVHRVELSGVVNK